jgi:hypothetical protein
MDDRYSDLIRLEVVEAAKIRPELSKSVAMTGKDRYQQQPEISNTHEDSFLRIARRQPLLSMSIHLSSRPVTRSRTQLCSKLRGAFIDGRPIWPSAQLKLQIGFSSAMGVQAPVEPADITKWFTRVAPSQAPYLAVTKIDGREFTCSAWRSPISLGATIIGFTR